MSTTATIQLRDVEKTPQMRSNQLPIIYAQIHDTIFQSNFCDFYSAKTGIAL